MPIRERLRQLLIGEISILNANNSISGLTFVFENGDVLNYQFHFFDGKLNYFECASRFGMKSWWESAQETADRVIESVVHLGRRVNDIAHVTTMFINPRENVLGDGRIWVFKGRVNVSNKAEATLYGFSECVALGKAKVVAYDRTKVYAFDQVEVHLKGDYAAAQVFDKARTARFL